MMLPSFEVGGKVLSALDLKCALIGTGMQYPERVYEAVAGQVRLESPTNLFACNGVILPGDIAVHLNVNNDSPYGLDLDDEGAVCLFYRGERISDVTFPEPTPYYEQETLSGTPYGAIAVLEGRSVLAFFYMWPCDYVKTNETCTFCFQVMADKMGFTLPSPSPEEVADIIAWTLENTEVQDIQLTAGTRFATGKECEQYATVLRAIDERVGLENIPSEIYCYMTAPKDPNLVNQVFEAGADRVAHDLHVWDPTLHAQVAPGHARAVGRDAQLRALEHIADTYGPNKAFSAFVAGLEPLDSMLEGAEFLASRGIVPAFSVWMPTPGSTTAENTPPDLAYYREARREFARLYKHYGLNPPGVAAGSHVSICRDIYRHMDQILSET